MRVCGKCGSTDIQESKKVLLRGQWWYIRNDGYRLWIRPAEGLENKAERAVMQYKYDGDPASDLAELFFSLLPEGQ